MKLIGKIQSAILDIFYPRICTRCGAYGAWVCELCEKSLSLFGGGCSAVYSYDDSSVRAIVHMFKYQGVTELASFMARAMGRVWNASHESSAASVDGITFVPIPLYRKKFQQRGWNHAELIAKELGALLHIPVEPKALERVRNTVPQSSLERRERLVNMQGAFAAHTTMISQVKTVVLIDDVMTTGATMEHAARALRKCGVMDIQSFVFARGSQQNHTPYMPK